MSQVINYNWTESNWWFNKKNMKNHLLPYHWKLVGCILVLAGIVMGVFYLWFDFRFTMPVFAVYSSFFETKICETFTTNFADELTLLLLLSGLTLIIFSNEKKETEYIAGIRNKAMTKALLSNNILLLASIFFVFGSGFIVILVVNIFLFSLFYLFFFYLMKQKKNIE